MEAAPSSDAKPSLPQGVMGDGAGPAAGGADAAVAVGQKRKRGPPLRKGAGKHGEEDDGPVPSEPLQSLLHPHPPHHHHHHHHQPHHHHHQIPAHAPHGGHGSPLPSLASIGSDGVAGPAHSRPPPAPAAAAGAAEAGPSGAAHAMGGGGVAVAGADAVPMPMMGAHGGLAESGGSAGGEGGSASKRRRVTEPKCLVTRYEEDIKAHYASGKFKPKQIRDRIVKDHGLDPEKLTAEAVRKKIGRLIDKGVLEKKASGASQRKSDRAATPNGKDGVRRGSRDGYKRGGGEVDTGTLALLGKYFERVQPELRVMTVHLKLCSNEVMTAKGYDHDRFEMHLEVAPPPHAVLEYAGEGAHAAVGREVHTITVLPPHGHSFDTLRQVERSVCDVEGRALAQPECEGGEAGAEGGQCCRFAVLKLYLEEKGVKVEFSL